MGKGREICSKLKRECRRLEILAQFPISTKGGRRQGISTAVIGLLLEEKGHFQEKPVGPWGRLY
jgi:hypothetical protein